MTQLCSQFDTYHGGPLHSVSFDLYGTKVATASSDETIRIWDVKAETGIAKFEQELRGHSGPVWQVCWAHPRFGPILASCGYDCRVIIWGPSSPSGGPGGPSFSPICTNESHTASINSIAFTVHTPQLILAAGSSDGCVSIITQQGPSDNQWQTQTFSAHFNGVLAVAWAPGGAREGIMGLMVCCWRRVEGIIK